MTIDIAAYEKQVLSFIDTRASELGPDDSGLYNYYASRAGTDHCLNNYDRFLLEYLAGERAVVHAGIGIGALTAGLALQGISCVGFEYDSRRYAAACAARAFLAPDADYEIRDSKFPQGLEDRHAVDSAVLLFTNVGATPPHGWTEAEIEATLEAMRRFKYTILDLRLFGETRDTEERRNALAARITDAGFRIVPMPEADSSGSYFYVRALPHGG